MKYLGGKRRQGPKIAQVMLPFFGDFSRYIEPFCGALGVACQVAKRGFGGNMLLSDNNPALVNLWNSLLDGWDPPSSVSEEEYQAIRKRGDVNDPLTAFCGHGLSWGGKWWGGYARYRNRNYARESRALLLKTVSLLHLSKVEIKFSDYREVFAIGLYYLDPPYSGAVWGHCTRDFDPSTFWEYARKRAREGSMVFVSEYSFPGDFVPVLCLGSSSSAGMGKARGRDEYVVIHVSQKGRFEAKAEEMTPVTR